MVNKLSKKNLPIIISLISLILSICSFSFGAFVQSENLRLAQENNEITNFTPYIDSSYSYSTLETSNYNRNESYAIFGGNVKIDLMVLSAHYCKIVVTLKSLNYSGKEDDNWLDLEKMTSISYDEVVHESFVERGFNPVKTEFSLSPLIDVKANSVNSNVRGFGFKLGNVTLEAELIDLVTDKIVITQDFNEGIFINVKEIN